MQLLSMLLAAAWIGATPLSEPRTEVAAAPLGSEIVVVGGFIANGANSRRVDTYAPSDDRWRRLPDLPVSVDHAAAASWRGRVFVVGATAKTASPCATAFVYDGSTWRRLPRPPEARGAAAAAATAAGRLYVVGGRDEAGSRRRPWSWTCARFRWRTLRSVPTQREHLAATAHAGLVYVVGGRRAGYDTNLTAFEVLDPRTGRWRALPRLPSATGRHRRRGARGADRLCRRRGACGTIASVWAYDVRTRRWSRLPDLPTPRHGLGVVTHGGKVWAIAGGQQPGLTVSGTVESIGLP